ncbi:MAG: PDZ domain-containing protein [Verrucomicrobiota bacterium]
MKSTTVTSISLVLASALAAWAQENPVPAPAAETAPVSEPAPAPNSDTPAPTSSESGATSGSGTGGAAFSPDGKPEPADDQLAQIPGITAQKQPGGKLLLSTGFGDKREVRVIDVASEESADAPLRVNFDTRVAGGNASGPVTFMGVSVSPAPEELSNHLPLVKGTGLVVQNVSKDSPAEKAGILRNDILVRFDDQILIHPSQFSVLVSGRKEGDSVKLSVLRKGTAQEIPVTLGKSDGGDPAGAPGTLKFGDVEVQLAAPGADSKPLRTYIKRWALDGNSPQVKELKMDSGGRSLRISGDEIKIEGDKLKVEGDKLKVLNDVLKNQADKIEGDARKQMNEALRNQTEALRRQSDALRQATGMAAKAAAQADRAMSAEAKAKAIQELEEALRKLKSE